MQKREITRLETEKSLVLKVAVVVPGGKELLRDLAQQGRLATAPDPGKRNDVRLIHVTTHIGKDVPARSWALLLEDRPLVEQDFLEQAPFHWQWI